MKIIVMWEDPSEQDAAENLARLLPRIGPSLAATSTDANGAVSVRMGARQQRLNIRTRVCAATEELKGAIETRLIEKGFTPEMLREMEDRIAEQVAATQRVPGPQFGNPLRDPGSPFAPGTPEDEGYRESQIKRSFGGQVVSVVPGGKIPERYREKCKRCGRVKDQRAWCVCVPPEVIEEQQKLMRGERKPKRKPPRETRDLIFPEEGE